MDNNQNSAAPESNEQKQPTLPEIFQQLYDAGGPEAVKKAVQDLDIPGDLKSSLMSSANRFLESTDSASGTIS